MFLRYVRYFHICPLQDVYLEFLFISPGQDVILYPSGVQFAN